MMAETFGNELAVHNNSIHLLDQDTTHYVLESKLRFPDLDDEYVLSVVRNVITMYRSGQIEREKAYDYCLIYSEYDAQVAHKIHESLHTLLGLRGCIIDELVEAGQHTIDVYEKMMDSSSKILFLITPHFNRDRFQIRMQNCAVFQSLMDKVNRRSQDKCVPVILESRRKIEIPFALRGVAGIKYDDSVQCVRVHFPKYFRKAVACRDSLQLKLDQDCCMREIDKRLEEKMDQEEKLKSIEAYVPEQRAIDPSQPSGGTVSTIAIPSIDQLRLNGGSSAITVSLPPRPNKQKLTDTSISNSSNISVGDHITNNITIKIYKDCQSESENEENNEADD